MIRIGVHGCGGRMGRMLLAEILGGEGLALSGGVERKGSELVGADLGELAGQGRTGMAATDDPAALVAASDVIIDFTAPTASLALLDLARPAGIGLVIGTTGLDAADEVAIQDAALALPIMRAANMSAGVTLMLALVEQMARALDDGYDIEIVEMHHRNKVDAPSGTALALGSSAARGRSRALSEVWRKSRDGITGARPRGEIGFAALRGGDVVGDHTVMFANEVERLEISHKASSRRVFASGAVRAARWLAGQKPGLYDMRDVLGLNGG